MPIYKSQYQVPRRNLDSIIRGILSGFPAGMEMKRKMGERKRMATQPERQEGLPDWARGRSLREILDLEPALRKRGGQDEGMDTYQQLRILLGAGGLGLGPLGEFIREREKEKKRATGEAEGVSKRGVQVREAGEVRAVKKEKMTREEILYDNVKKAPSAGAAMNAAKRYNDFVQKEGGRSVDIGWLKKAISTGQWFLGLGPPRLGKRVGRLQPKKSIFQVERNIIGPKGERGVLSAGFSLPKGWKFE